jgi:hypothetical protein
MTPRNSETQISVEGVAVEISVERATMRRRRGEDGDVETIASIDGCRGHG